MKQDLVRNINGRERKRADAYIAAPFWQGSLQQESSSRPQKRKTARLAAQPAARVPKNCLPELRKHIVPGRQFRQNAVVDFL